MKYWIMWQDGYRTGHVDYAGDFVTDEFEETAMFFDTKEQAERYIAELNNKFPLARVEVVEYEGN